MRAIKIPVEGELEVVDLPSSYPEINEALFGTAEYLVEEVRVRGLAHLYVQRNTVTLLIDEEGLMHELPLNERATILYGGHVHGSPIVGNAWVVYGNDEEWVDLPEAITLEVVADAIALSMEHPGIFA